MLFSLFHPAFSPHRAIQPSFKRLSFQLKQYIIYYLYRSQNRTRKPFYFLHFSSRRSTTTTIPKTTTTMISDTELNTLAIFLGSVMMGLIVVYHFLAVNANQNNRLID